MNSHADVKKPQLFNELINRIIALEELTPAEAEALKKICYAATDLPEAIEGEPSSTLILEQLEISKHALKISPTSEKKIRAHIELMETVLQGWGMNGHFPGLSALALHYKDIEGIGSDDVTDFTVASFPGDKKLLEQALKVLEKNIDFFNVYYTGYAANALTGAVYIACEVGIKGIRRIDDEEITEKEMNRQEKIQEAISFAAEHEEELLALVRIKQTNAEFLTGIIGTIETEGKKEGIMDTYMNMYKDRQIIVESENSSRYVRNFDAVMLAMRTDYALKAEPITSVLNQNKKLATALMQYPTARAIQQTIGKKDLTPQQTLNHVQEILKSGAVHFQKDSVSEENRDSKAKKFFKRVAELVTFGLAKKLWTETKTETKTKGEHYLEKTHIFAHVTENSAKRKAETMINEEQQHGHKRQRTQ